jgi:hypothetical protein
LLPSCSSRCPSKVYVALKSESAVRLNHPLSGLVQGPEVMTTDKYATAEAYYGLARAYSSVTDLHIMWLLYLCEVHQGNQSYAEAAQCAVAVAGVIMQVFAPVIRFFCLV